MKTNELMIGDFVRFTSDQWETEEDAQPVRIIGINEPVYPENIPYILIEGKCNVTYHIELFEPIPLTDEILDKNNFEIVEVKGQKYYRYCAYYLYPDYNGGFIVGRWHNKLGFVASTSTRLRNVHELQHVLRWVGYSIADNLKVE